jgi:hypothetical protein
MTRRQMTPLPDPEGVVLGFGEVAGIGPAYLPVGQSDLRSCATWKLPVFLDGLIATAGG